MLSPDERARSERLRGDDLRAAYALSHAALRTLLARYLGTEPQQIRFALGAHGKPRVDVDGAPCFNASASGDLAVFAFARACDVGIDVEAIRPGNDLLDLARRFFCAEEVAELTTLAADAREPAFFACWTRKEAYVKAIGAGLSIPLDSFCVTMLAGEPARVVRIGGDVAAAREWSMHDVTIADGYACALAYRGRARALRIAPPIDAGELLEP